MNGIIGIRLLVVYPWVGLTCGWVCGVCCVMRISRYRRAIPCCPKARRSSSSKGICCMGTGVLRSPK